MNWTIKGRVLHGKKYGRKIGYPTANLDRRGLKKSDLIIVYGVFAGLVSIEGESESDNTTKKLHKAALIIGPKDRRGLPKIEAHLIGFKGDLYGKKLTLEFKKFIRPYKNFSSEKELIEQIEWDIPVVLSYL